MPSSAQAVPAHIKSKALAYFSSSVALSEVSHLEQKLDDIDIGDGLVEVHWIKKPYVKIPVGNHTQQNIKKGMEGLEVNKENSLVL